MIKFIKRIFNSWKYKQTCFIYCHKCGNELIASNSWQFTLDDGTEYYQCTHCGEESIWDFDLFPCPVRRIEL